MSSSDAETLYNTLFAEASSPKRRNSLTILWQALTELQSEGAKDYSIARVGKKVEKLGGPRTQSLRNKDGADFRRLIEQFGSSQGYDGRTTPRAMETQVQRAIREIPDLGVQTILRMTLEENRRLKHEIDMLRSAYRELQVDPGREPGASSATDTEQIEVLDSATVSVRVPKKAIVSVEQFLSESWMEELGFRVEPDGSIVDMTSRGSLVAPSYFADALKSIAATVRTNTGVLKTS
jgi:hypothetical protein